MDAEFARGVCLRAQSGGHGDLHFAARKFERGRRTGLALSFDYRSDAEHDRPLVVFQN